MNKVTVIVALMILVLPAARIVTNAVKIPTSATPQLAPSRPETTLKIPKAMAHTI